MSRRVALVTGATGAIGRAIGFALLREGAEVILHGRTPERCAALAAAARSLGKAEVVAGDLTREADLAALAARVGARGRLDLLSLGAGIYERGAEPASLARQLAANLLGPHALLTALRPFLVAAQGQVVVLNSTQALNASPGLGGFAATQHALRALTDAFRGEVNAEGVRVLTIYLGRTASERQRAIFALEGRPYPEARLIQPEDVAQAALALAALPRTAEATELTLRPMVKHS